MPDDPLPTTVGGLSPEQVKARTKLSEDFRSVFCNHIRVAGSLTEIRMFIGESYPTASDQINVVEHFCVVMTPSQAKSAAVTLTSIIQQVEAMVGTIKVPESIPPKRTPESPS